MSGIEDTTTPDQLRHTWQAVVDAAKQSPDLAYRINEDAIPSPQDFAGGRRMAQQNTLMRMAFCAFQEGLFPAGTKLQVAYQGYDAPDALAESDHAASPLQAERTVTLRDARDVLNQIYTRNVFEPFTLFATLPGEEKAQAFTDVNSLWNALKPYAAEQKLHHVAPDFEKDFPFTERSWELAGYELANSVNNEMLSAAAQLRLFKELKQTIGNGQDKGAFWDWMTREDGLAAYVESAQQGRNDRPSTDALMEQFMVQFASFSGHRTHPMGKTKVHKLPASAERDVEAYSMKDQLGHLPEFGNSFPVHILALKKERTEVDAAADVEQGQDMQAYIQAHFPKAFALWQEELTERGLDPQDYTPVPTHPLQLDEIKRRFEPLLSGEEPDLVMTQKAQLPAFGSMSVRTVVTEEGKGLHMKMPLNSQFTSVLRTMAPERVTAGPVISDLVTELAAHDRSAEGAHITGNGENEQLRFLREPMGVRLIEGENVKYQDTYQLNTLFKESPADYTKEDEVRLNLASLFQMNPLTEQPLIVDIMQANGVDSPDAAQQYFADYAAQFTQPHIGMLLNYGVSLESHQQNAYVMFNKNGAPKATLYSDMSGGIEIHKPTLMHHLQQHAPERVDAWEDKLQTIHKSLSDIDSIKLQTLHTLFTVNLLPMVDVLEKHFGADREQMLGTLRDQVQNVLDAEKERDPNMPEEKRDMVNSLEQTMLDAQEKWGNKSLFTMRIRQTQKSIPIAGDNGLYR